MYWIQSINNGPRRVNHAAAYLDNFIYSFGGYSNTEDYSSLTPIDVHRLNIGFSFSFSLFLNKSIFFFKFHLDTLKWYQILKPNKNDIQYSSTPYSRYGHTIIVYQRKFYLWGGRNDHSRACNQLFCFNPGLFAFFFLLLNSYSE